MVADGHRLPPAPPGGVPGNTAAWYLRPIPTLEWCARRYGDAFTLRLVEVGPFVFVSDPEDVRAVFAATARGAARAGEVNALLAPVVGAASVLTSDGSRHLRQRRLLLPPFHGERLAVYRERMAERSSAMVDAWPLGVPFATSEPFQRLTLELIIGLVFGVRDAARRERMLDVLPALTRSATPVLFFPALGRDMGPRSPGARFRRLREHTHALVREEIEAHRREGGLEDREDVLSLLMAARDEDGAPLSDEDLRDELLTLLFAGHETTATALSWAVDLALHHPEVHERLREAARTGDDAYLDAVVNEVHRVRPTVPNVVRRLREPLRLGGWDLPAGVVVAPVAWLTHRRPDVYPEPEAFRPERFLGERPGTYTWLPFGGGIRRCIGASFAQLEMREVLRVVFSRATLEPESPRQEAPRRRTVTAVPRRGARVVLMRREPA